MDENQRGPEVEYRLGVRVLPDLGFVGVVILWEDPSGKGILKNQCS
jgi:hypothetical protein